MEVLQHEPNDNRPIGIFDSGIGGLTVVKVLREQLPNEDILYLGDNARVPYGVKSKEIIARYALEDVRFLAARQIKLIVAACNTVSATAMDTLRHHYPNIPIFSVVEAGVEYMCTRFPDTQRVLVLGTTATVNSDAYRLLIHKRSPHILVRSRACPLFVPMIEEGLLEGDIAEAIVHHYLDHDLDFHPQVVILGCTHYPLLKPLIQELFGKEIKIVDSAEACAYQLIQYLNKNHLLATASPLKGSLRCFVTDLPVTFHQTATRFLGTAPDHIEKVTLS